MVLTIRILRGTVVWFAGCSTAISGRVDVVRLVALVECSTVSCSITFGARLFFGGRRDRELGVFVAVCRHVVLLLVCGGQFPCLCCSSLLPAMIVGGAVVGAVVGANGGWGGVLLSGDTGEM